MTRERDQLKRTKAKTERPQDGLDQELVDHQEEITELNQKYKKALSQKAAVYDELIECLKELVSRGGSYTEKHYKKIHSDAKAKIIQMQLEQKEKRECDLKARHKDLFQLNPQLLDLVEENTRKMMEEFDAKYRGSLDKEEAEVEVMERVAAQKGLLH